MKRLMIVCGLISILNAACAQQMQKLPAQRAEHRTLVLEKQLALSKDQAKQVNEIMLAQVFRIDSLKASSRAARRNRRLAKQKILMQTDQRLKKVFSADQNAAYLNWKEQKKANHKRNTEKAG